MAWLDAPAWVSSEREAVTWSTGRESKEMVEQVSEREREQILVSEDEGIF